MAKTSKSQISNSKPKTSESITKNITKITKSKLVSKDANVVSTRRSVPLNRLNFGGLHRSDLESKIVWKVLSNFTLTQQLKMRTISPVWDYNVQLAFKQIRSLDLRWNCANDKIMIDRVRAMACKLEINSWGNFIRNHDKNSKQTSMTNKVAFNIQASKWKQSDIVTLGKLFCNVEQMTIHYTVETDDNELLFNLLRYFPKVTTFSFIAGTKIIKNNKNFATKLFAAIADHLAPLTSLHLYFETTHSPRVSVSDLSKILPFLQNLSLSCPIKNYHQIIEMMGTNLPSHLPIQSLNIIASNLKVSQIKQIFKRNPKLAKMKRLQLMDVNSRELVDCLLDRFTELECLDICAGSKLNTIKNDYSVEWMKTFSKLTHLTELILVGMHPKNFDIEVPVALSTVRCLTFIYPHFMSIICMDWLRRNMNEESIHEPITKDQVTQILKEFAVSFVKQYPNLEQLTFGWDFEYRSQFVKILKAKYDNLQTYFRGSLNRFETISKYS